MFVVGRNELWNSCAKCNQTELINDIHLLERRMDELLVIKKNSFCTKTYRFVVRQC